MIDDFFTRFNLLYLHMAGGARITGHPVYTYIYLNILNFIFMLQINLTDVPYNLEEEEEA